MKNSKPEKIKLCCKSKNRIPIYGYGSHDFSVGDMLDLGVGVRCVIDKPAGESDYYSEKLLDGKVAAGYCFDDKREVELYVKQLL